jgi:hypothetical protein
MKASTSRLAPRTSRRSLLFTLVASLVAAGGCGAAGDDLTDSSEGAQTAAAPAVWATQNWTDRTAWYKTEQGSHLIDYGVFMTLERADTTEPLATRESLERFGFVYPMDAGLGTLTSDKRLPLGVLKDRDDAKKRDFAGFSCAACHTGEIVHEGKRILVDGGPTFLQFEPFMASLQEALDTTSNDAAKKRRFCDKLADQSGCETRLRESKERIDAMRKRNHQTVPDGPGRLDAISRILNDVFSPKELGGQLGGEKPVDVQVPVSIPAVWDAPRLTCVQTNCLATDSFTRNSGEVLGVFGHSSLARVGDKLTVTGSPKADNIYALEKSLESLQSPKWESNFGSLDRAKTKRGEALFEETCAGCHTEPYKKAAGSLVSETAGGQTRSLWKVTKTPYKDVGTDPRFIEVHGPRKVDDDTLNDLFDQALKLTIGDVYKQGHGGNAPNILVLDGLYVAAKAKQVFDGIRTVDGKISSLLMLGAVTGTFERTTAAQQADGDPVEAEKIRQKLKFYRAPLSSVDLAVYRARPLNGIAFTFPYGHNGAWPSLWDVLQKPGERTKKFVVRPSSFDPKKVGLDISPAKGGEKLFELDTSAVANSNKGHTYGTDLSDDDKDDLIEYLKSL